jgi:uncharacterized Ntn-hydrolase superfamily protein
VTFSVVARDPATGELGIAVSSCILAVGRAVPSARPGIGVVAVQARSRRGLGTMLLAGLADGAAPADLVRRAAHAAPEDADRQVAVLSARGEVAADTGQGSFPVSGHLIGDQMSVQGNMLASTEVLPAMSQAFAAARGDLADRLLASLTAGQDAGGDLRGRGRKGVNPGRAPGTTSGARLVPIQGSARLVIPDVTGPRPGPGSRRRRRPERHRLS